MNISNFNFEELPKTFGIRHCNHPRWEEYIEVMNEWKGGAMCGKDSDWYYGIDIDGNYDLWTGTHCFNYVIITVDEFFGFIEGAKEIVKYEIY